MKMTSLLAVKRFCIHCVGGPAHAREVRSCGGDKCLNGGCDPKGVCLFHRFRMGSGRTRVATIRKMCLWCMGESSSMVETCHTTECPLHRFRLGKNPNISETSKLLAAERLAARGGFVRQPVVVADDAC
jgi:hypothetical protein